MQGDLSQVVLVFPWWFFTKWSATDQQAALFAIYGTLLRTLPLECEVIAVINAEYQLPAITWINAQKRPGPLRIEPFNVDPTPWIRDPFCTVLVDGAAHLVEPCAFLDGRQNDTQLAEELSEVLGHPSEIGNDIFAGGNVLAGIDYVFVGADIAKKIAHMQGESDEDAVARALTELETAGTRTPIVVGTKAKVPDEDETTAAPNVYHLGNKDSFQPLFHIDMFMTLAVGKDGRDAVVLGRPSLARKIMPDAWPLEAELDAELGEIADMLRARNIAVHEIPMPLFGVQDSDGKIRFYYALYPNALVQTGSSRRVWLPQFALLWEAVKDVDDAVAKVWVDELGYEVVPIQGCTQLAMSMAGVHCATHDILRTATQAES